MSKNLPSRKREQIEVKMYDGSGEGANDALSFIPKSIRSLVTGLLIKQLKKNGIKSLIMVHDEKRGADGEIINDESAFKAGFFAKNVGTLLMEQSVTIAELDVEIHQLQMELKRERALADRYRQEKGMPTRGQELKAINNTSHE